jgi:hypothetical protein
VAFKNLIYCEQELIRKYGGEAVLMLSGDLHHYCRYSAQGGVRQKITSGGGGAYLYPTHRMPDELHLKEELESAQKTGEPESPPVIYRREDNPFPSVSTSRLLRFGVLLFPFKNLKFCLLLCSLYLVFAWLLESGSQKLPESFMEQVSMLSPLEAGHIQGVFWSFLESVKHSPSSVLFMLAIVLGLIAFSGLIRFPFGLLHGTAHIGLNIYLIWNFTYLNKQVFSMTRIDQIPHAFLFSAEMFAIGGILGGLLMGLYLFLSELLTGLHTNEVFSAQRIADHKSFLRLHIDEKGDLRIFPVGVARICRKWKFNQDAADGQPWFEPEDGSIGSRAHLIEGPILIKSARVSN